jgi:hypothetical protein
MSWVYLKKYNIEFTKKFKWLFYLDKSKWDIINKVIKNVAELKKKKFNIHTW